MVLSAAIVYAYFLYQPIQGELMGHLAEYREIERAKAEIAGVMLDPSAADARIAELSDELAAMQRAGYITPATVISDINSRLRMSGIESAGVSFGASALSGAAGAMPGAVQLRELPLAIELDSGYESGIGFIASLEQSTEATYIIDSFACTLPEDGGSSASASSARGNARGNAGASGGEAKMKWVLAVRLLYYGED